MPQIERHRIDGSPWPLFGADRTVFLNISMFDNVHSRLKTWRRSRLLSQHGSAGVLQDYEERRPGASRGGFWHGPAVIDGYEGGKVQPKLRRHGWPQNDTCDHWRDEVATFQVEAIACFTPSMRQRIDLPGAYKLAQRQVAPVRRGDHTGLPAPASCPVTFDQLLTASVEGLEAPFASQPAG
jgi:hypothetical protein